MVREAEVLPAPLHPAMINKVLAIRSAVSKECLFGKLGAKVQTFFETTKYFGEKK